jgi:hypothetical protein
MVGTWDVPANTPIARIPNLLNYSDACWASSLPPEPDLRSFARHVSADQQRRVRRLRLVVHGRLAGSFRRVLQPALADPPVGQLHGRPRILQRADDAHAAAGRHRQCGHSPDARLACSVAGPHARAPGDAIASRRPGSRRRACWRPHRRSGGTCRRRTRRRSV